MAAAAAAGGAPPPAPSRSPIGCTAPGADDAPFRAWCDAHKVLWPKLAVGATPETGRCVLAKEAISEGEVVVEIPDDAVLMAENCSIAEQLAEAGLSKPAADALLEVQGLVVAVMAERALGPKSKWAPYLAFLPDSMDHMPVYWEPAELEELRGTAALDKLAGRVQHPADAPTRTAELFEALVLPLVEGDKGLAKVLLGPKGLPEKGKAAEEARAKLLEQYKWATSAVASYSFILGDAQFQSMCPVWDLLNHITGRVNVRLHHDAERGALQMIATRPISAGEEVVNNYGCLSNADLLRGYGYVEERNENEHAQVPGQFLVRAAAGAKQRAAADAKGAGAGGAGAGGKEGVDKEAGEEEEEGSSDDGEVYESDDDEGESSDDSEESSEPDYELEDDYAPPGGGGGSEDEGGGSEDGGEGGEEEGGEALTAARAAAKAAGSPLLVDAAEVIPDWEDRWALAHALRLLPKGGVFGVFSGGAPPREMVAVTALLLAGVPQCKRLLAAAQKAGRGGGEEAGGGGGGASVAAELQLPPAGQLQDALRAAARLMLLRYTCGLEADEKLLADAGKLPPRLHAAVRARAGEKRCLHAMLQWLEDASGHPALDEVARGAIADGLDALAERRRAAAAVKCGGGEEEGESEDEEEQGEQEAGAKGARKRTRGAHACGGCASGACGGAHGAEGGGEEGDQQRKQRGGDGEKRQAAEQGEAPTDKSFNFGFKL